MPRVPTGVAGGRIIGWGTALPDKVVTNDDLARTMDTTDEWIVERTGIRRRHVGGTTASLSVEAGRRALDMAGVDPASIDALVLSTTTPDRTVPGTAPSVQHALGCAAARSTSTRRARASSTPSSRRTACSPSARAACS